MDVVWIVIEIIEEFLNGFEFFEFVRVDNVLCFDLLWMSVYYECFGDKFIVG